MNEPTELKAMPDESAFVEMRDNVLAPLEAKLVASRKSAIEGRKQTGIEDEWRRIDDAYEGIDESNRSSFGRKAITLEGPIHFGGARRGSGPTETKSNAFLNITRPYVDSSAARVADMLLPTNALPFKIEATAKSDDDMIRVLSGRMPLGAGGIPQPSGQTMGMSPEGMEGPGNLLGGPPSSVASDMSQPLSAANDISQVPNEVSSESGMPMGMGAEGEMMPGAEMASEMPLEAPPSPLEVAMQQADERLRVEKAHAAAANTQVRDWLQESRWHSEARKLIENAAKLGTGVMKGPFPMRRKLPKEVKAILSELPPEMQSQLMFRPGSKTISVKNFYPDPACGDNIQDGAFVFEKVPMSARRLKELAEDSSYFPERIKMCLDEGPKDSEGKDIEVKGEKGKTPYELWFYTGMIPESALSVRREDEASSVESDAAPAVFAQAVLCNEVVIKVWETSLEIEEFPYDVLNWGDREDSWAGIGVGAQMDTPQRGLNAAARNMLDNAAISGGPQIIYFKGIIKPRDGRWELKPRKLWEAEVDPTSEGISQVKNVFTTVDIPNRQSDLMEIINFFLAMAEKTTGLPSMLQGQSTNSTPDTASGMQMLANNASTVLRRLARNFDDSVTEPHVGRYYEWIKEYGPEEAQGDLKVNAIGSSTLVERDLQVTALQNLLPMSLDPSYGVSPAKVMKLLVESQRFDYEAIKLDDEELGRMEEASQTPDVQVQVAQIRAESDQAVEEGRAQMDKYEADLKAETELAKLGAKREGETEKVVSSEGVEAMKVGAASDESARAGQADTEKADMALATSMLDQMGIGE